MASEEREAAEWSLGHHQKAPEMRVPNQAGWSQRENQGLKPKLSSEPNNRVSASPTMEGIKIKRSAGYKTPD